MAKWILPLLLLVGCGEQQPIDQELATNYGHGYHYDYADQETGTKVRIPTSLTTTRYTFPDIVGAYKSVQVCTGLSASGPLVIVMDTLPDGTNNGLHLSRTGTILIADSDSLRHEMIHYLLEQTGFPRDRNNQHDSALFALCHYA